MSSYGFCWRPFFLLFFFFFAVLAVEGCRPWAVGGVVPGVESRSGVKASLAEGIQPGCAVRRWSGMVWWRAVVVSVGCGGELRPC